MHTQLIFFDVEGTLTGPNGRGHDERLMRSFSILKSKKRALGLCTGRDSLYAKALHRVFDLNGPIIAEAGCELIPTYSHFETESKNMGGFTANEKIEILSKLEIEGVLSKMNSDDKKQYMITLYPNGFPNHREQDLLDGYLVTKRSLSVFSRLVVTHSSAAVDIVPQGVSKGATIISYCEAEEIPLDKVAYIGDSWNDLSAFEAVGHGGGVVGYVGKDETILQSLDSYKTLRSHEYGSSGVVELLEKF